MASILLGLAVVGSVMLIVLKEPEAPVAPSAPTVSAPVEDATVIPEYQVPPPETTSVPAPARPSPAVPETPPTPEPIVAVRGPVERPPEPAPKRSGALAFVIDDAGNNLTELEPFLRLDGPLSIAVLPGLPHSAEAARRIRAAGKELLLHQPMEAVGGQNPGPGAIYHTMDAVEIRTVLARNLAEVGPVAGMNNHQGSRITADPEAMETVLAFCRDNGIYFLDSRTTAETAVSAVAARLGIRIRERDVFVDNVQEKAAMIRFVQEGLQKAEKKGAAVMIGHAWSSELAATLEELYPELVEQGFSLSTISRIMMGTWDDEGFGD